MNPPPYAHIYLSPHLDDVALSCGGAIYDQVCTGASDAEHRVLVATFFAASPTDDAFNDFTRELKARWGGAEDAVAVRRQEDLCGTRILGADALHLPFLDCVYRRDARTGEAYYPTVAHIFDAIHPAEAQWHQVLLAALLAQVGDPGRATFYAPLTTRQHVDHILVRRAAMLLVAQGRDVYFYEDFPPEGNADAVLANLRGVAEGTWHRHVHAFDEQALRAKGDAVACYASQISTFWPNAVEMRQALRTQALAVGVTRYAESAWRFAQKEPPQCHHC